MSFSFPSYRALKGYLGQIDAMVEVTELAVEHLIHEAEQSGDIGKFIKKVSKDRGVSVHVTELNSVRLHLVQTYIVSSYRGAELFFSEFRREHNAFYGSSWRKSDPNLEAVLGGIAETKAKAKAAIGEDLVSRFDYYHKIRNWIEHPRDQKLKGKAEETFAAIPAWSDRQIETWSAQNREPFENLNAPNKPDNLSFDDFVLFTRVTKEIAHRACSLALPTPNDLLTTAQQRFSKHIGNQDKFEEVVINWVKTEFGFGSDDAKSLTKEIIAH